MQSTITFTPSEDMSSHNISANPYELPPPDISYLMDDNYMNQCINGFMAQEIPTFQQSYQTPPFLHLQQQQLQQDLPLQQQHHEYVTSEPQYYYGSQVNDVSSVYSYHEEDISGSSAATTVTPPKELIKDYEVHQYQQLNQVQGNAQQPQPAAVDLFPPATACTPPPITNSTRRNSTVNTHNGVVSNEHISRRESFESEFDFKTVQSNVAVSPNSLGVEYNDLADETIEMEGEDNDDYEGSADEDYNFEKQDIDLSSIQIDRYPVVRGVSSGGSATKPPQGERNLDGYEFIKCKLSILNADENSVCMPQWNDEEKSDKRRIIRIERRQRKNEIIASFTVVGSAKENPVTVAPQPGVDVTEVSCLECYFSDEFSEADYSNVVSSDGNESHLKKRHYITSVEVIKVVELLIGTQNPNPKDRRKERGRIRSNLVPFWSKKPISSKKLSSVSSPSEVATYVSGKTNADFRNELAQRIMGYEARKPRGFDKEVRILEWNKLVPALKRALQSYYARIPVSDLE